MTIVHIMLKINMVAGLVGALIAETNGQRENVVLLLLLFLCACAAGIYFRVSERVK
jgi:hypothetical protein